MIRFLPSKTVLQTAFAGAVLLFTTGAGPNPNSTVTRVNGGTIMGNPEADVTLTEYISYTCPHCATFAKEGEAPLKLAYVSTGKLKHEIRHLLRDPVDMTAALLVNCGAVSRFEQNHAAFMLSQDSWIGLMSTATQAQRQRWSGSDAASSMRAIASDFGFYKIMERRGYTRAQADQCLNNKAKADEMARISLADWKKPGITGTPAFAINGAVLTGTHSWRALETQLRARFQ